MAGPGNKENIEVKSSGPVQLPRPDQAAIMSADGAAQLPARPRELGKNSKEADPSQLESARDREKLEERRIEQRIKDKLGDIRLESIEGLVRRSELDKKTVIDKVLFGEKLNNEIHSVAESIVKLTGNAALLNQLASGSLDQKALAQHLMGYIQQQRFGCSAQELGMLDSLEHELTRILQQINPNLRIQQQQQQDDMARDDDSGSSGPDRVEDDEKESGYEAAEEADTDSDMSYSPRSKKGRARARARAMSRRNRFKRWLARMMRVFRGQGMVVRGPGVPQASAGTQVRDQRFVRTVRIFGKVINAKDRTGIKGVKIVSNTLGSALTAADGSFAFENVAHGISYSLAPLKSGYSFTPLSVNDVALDYREHIFMMVED